jgi:hypothetical protein
MFLIDIPFKGCQGRSNWLVIVHAVSYFACGVNDTDNAFLIFLNTSVVLHDFHLLKLFEIFLCMWCQ